MLCLDSFENQRICKRGTVHSCARCVVFRWLVSDIERGLCRCARIAFRRFHGGVFCPPVELPERNAALQCLKRVPVGLAVYGLVLPFLLVRQRHSLAVDADASDWTPVRINADVFRLLKHGFHAGLRAHGRCCVWIQERVHSPFRACSGVLLRRAKARKLFGKLLTQAGDRVGPDVINLLPARIAGVQIPVIRVNRFRGLLDQSGRQGRDIACKQLLSYCLKCTLVFALVLQRVYDALNILDHAEVCNTVLHGADADAFQVFGPQALVCFQRLRDVNAEIHVHGQRLQTSKIRDDVAVLPLAVAAGNAAPECRPVDIKPPLTACGLERGLVLVIVVNAANDSLQCQRGIARDLHCAQRQRTSQLLRSAALALCKRQLFARDLRLQVADGVFPGLAVDADRCYIDQCADGSDGRHFADLPHQNCRRNVQIVARNDIARAVFQPAVHCCLHALQGRAEGCFVVERCVTAALLGNVERLFCRQIALLDIPTQSRLCCTLRNAGRKSVRCVKCCG